MIAALALAAAVPGGLTLEEALTLPQAVLTERVLGAAGGLYREVRRPRTGGLPGPAGFMLEFASAPRATPFPGLCEANILTLQFTPLDGGRAGGAMRVEAMGTSHAYRNVGDGAEPGRAGDARGREIEALCAQAGPVLEQPGTDRILPHFFTGRYEAFGDLSARPAYFAALALDKLKAAARAGRLPETSCRNDGPPDPTDCADALASLARLPLDRLNGVVVARCAEPQELCVQVGFSPIDELNSHRVRVVRIHTDQSALEGPGPAFALRRVEIEDNSFVN